MQKISDYLKKFQKIGFLNTQNRDVIKEILVDNFGKELGELIKFEIKGKTIKISAPSVIRSEIFIKKSEILKSVNEKVEGVNFLEIK